MKERLTPEDILTIKNILQGYIETEGHTEREGEYPEIFQKIYDGMCHDDAIVTDGNYVAVVHG